MKDILKKFLDFLQHHSRTDIRYLARGSFWSSLSYYAQVSFGVIITIALANGLSKEALGTYQFILATIGTVSAFTLTGLNTAITRAVAQGNDGVLRSGVRTKLRWSSGIILASLLLAGYYAYNGDLGLATSFLIAGICTAIIESFVLYESYLVGKKYFKETVTLGLWRKPLPVVALLITLCFTTNIPTLVGVYFGSTMFTTVMVYLAVIKRYKPPNIINHEAIAYGKQLTMIQIVSQALAHIDKILLWHLLGPAAVASFAVAQLAARYSGGLAGSISYVSLPKVAQRDLQTLQVTLPRKAALFTLAIVPIMIVYMVTIPYVLPLLFPTYPESILLAQVLGLSFLFLPRSVYTHALTAHKQTRLLYIGSTTTAIFRLVTMFILISLFEIWGAIYALLLTSLFEIILSRYLFSIARSESSENDSKSVPG